MPKPPPVDPEEEAPVFKNELEEVLWNTNRVTDESVDSTRRMVSLCAEAKEAGIKTLVALDDQGEKIEKMAKGMIDINEDLVEAEKAMRGMGAPCWGLCAWLPCNEPEESKEERALWKGEGDGKKGGGNMPARESDMTGVPTYGGFIAKYQDKDAREDEMEKNMEDVSNCVANLRNMAIDMGTEIENQNETLDRINLMCESNDARLTAANERAHQLAK